MDLKEMMLQLNEIYTLCWICKKELRDYEVCKVTDGSNLDIDLCFECYGMQGADAGLSEKDTFQVF
ncbi:hypothetical protein GLW00_02645 [Halobacillus litoralis]|uniref:Uncharacterized protein n=1 Tax=Halobacillus litoralis TaxID=45668 RepID=A0A845F718_9BACI|nr:hypothetical protein [Halobacillus litoralis]MYL69730.1 hypothetical protein [Halobacillus litoralis]